MSNNDYSVSNNKSNIMLKKPLPLRRKSFGGQTLGIFWRKRTSTPTTTSLSAEADEKQAKKRNNDICGDVKSKEEQNKKRKNSKVNRSLLRQETPVTNTEEARIIGWDDILCRPIYYRPCHGNDCDASTVSGHSGMEEEVDSGSERKTETAESHVRHVTDSSLDFNECYPTEDNDNIKSNYVVNDPYETDIDYSIESFKPFSVPTRKKAKTFGSRGLHRRPLSLTLIQEDCNVDDTKEEKNEEQDTHKNTAATTTIHRGSRRVSLEFMESNSHRAKNDGIRFDSSNKNNSELHNDTPAFRIGNSSLDSNRKTCPRSHKWSSSDGEGFPPNPQSSLDRARDYFSHLDKTQPLLTFDSALSPAISSKITRTRRKTNFTSPGINRNYQAYSKSSVHSGVTPLSIKDFASMRKLKNGQIVDGFFDE